MNIKTGLLTRTFELDTRAISKEARTIPLSFSSEEPVERFFGIEILDHKPESVRMDRLKKGVPILLNHDRDKQVGILESPSIDGDRKGRGIARLGASSLATEVWQDIQDGIRKEVSVGYRIHQMVMEKQEGDTSTYRATDWEPLEVSIVSIPADVSVGIGRGEGSEFEIIVKDEKGNFMDEKKRVSEIMAIGQKLGDLDRALEYVQNGKSLDEYRGTVLDEAASKLRPTVHVGQNREELAPFKNFDEYLFCVKYASADPRLRSLWREDVGRAFIKHVGEQRALSMGVGAAGGFAVPSQFRPELLSVEGSAAMIRPRARVIPAGDPPDSAISIPALDQGTTRGNSAGFHGHWISEGGEKPEFIARRMIILAAEDIGLANPNALLLATNCFQAIHMVGWPESRIILSEAAIYLATSPKSNSSVQAIDGAQEVVRNTGDLSVPLHIRNAPTPLMKELGYGKDYKYAHSYEGNFVPDDFLPKEILGTKLYDPQDNAREEELRQRLRNWWKEKYKY